MKLDSGQTGRYAKADSRPKLDGPEGLSTKMNGLEMNEIGRF